MNLKWRNYSSSATGMKFFPIDVGDLCNDDACQTIKLIK